jgi:hypothetical protein
LLLNLLKNYLPSSEIDDSSNERLFADNSFFAMSYLPMSISSDFLKVYGYTSGSFLKNIEDFLGLILELVDIYDEL